MGTKARLTKRIKHQVNDLLEDAINIAEAFQLDEENSGVLKDAREYFSLHINSILYQAPNKALLAKRLAHCNPEELESRFGSYEGYFLQNIEFKAKPPAIALNLICLDPDPIFLDLVNEDLDEESLLDLTQHLRDLDDLEP